MAVAQQPRDRGARHSLRVERAGAKCLLSLATVAWVGCNMELPTFEPPSAEDSHTDAAESGVPLPPPPKAGATAMSRSQLGAELAGRSSDAADPADVGEAGAGGMAMETSPVGPRSGVAGRTGRFGRRDAGAEPAADGGSTGAQRQGMDAAVPQEAADAGVLQPEAAVDGGAAGAEGGCLPNLACQLTAPASTGDAHQDCVDRINQFREQCACLPPLERWVEGEACADEMARYDSGGTQAHAAFVAGICEGGSAQNECPGWRSHAQVVSVCLQKMWDEGPPPMSDCTGSCFQTYGHFLNMSSQRMSKVACGFYQTAEGQIWSVQNFSR